MQTLEQFTNVIAPETGKIVAVGVDGTSRSYDLSSLDMPHAWRHGGTAYVTFVADGAAVYIAFGDDSVAVDETAEVTAGQALAFTTDAAWLLPDGAPQSFVLPRGDQSDLAYFAVKTASGTATLRLYVSSHPTR